MRRRPMAWLLLGAFALSRSVPAGAAGKLNVVTTLSTFADLVKTIGGEHVEVSSVASPKFNPHFIEPKPSDVLRVKRADLFAHGGLDLELWRGPLLDAAGNREVMPGGPRELDLSRGIGLLEVPDHPVSRAEGDIHLYGNPHYWVDPDNARIMAQHICEKLSEIDPPHAPEYRRNLEGFLQRLDAKIAGWRQRLAPYQGQELVCYHNEWPYLMRFAGLRMTRFLEPKPGIPPTPKQLEVIEQYIKEQRLRGIVQATYFPEQAADTIAKRTGAKVILLCQNVREVPDASDYLATVEYNVKQLTQGLQP